MSNDLSGAIKRALYIADLQDQLAAICVAGKARDDCFKRAVEYRQLAAWLEELTERRKLPEIVKCKDCENWDTTWQNDSAPNYHYCPIMDGTYSGDFYCAKSERRTDVQ